MKEVLYSFDPVANHLFSWDGEFHYCGKTDNPPKPSVWVNEQDRDSVSALACYFVSGSRGCADVLNADSGVVRNFGKNGGKKNAGKIVCVYGESVKDPARVAAICKSYSFSYACFCPLVEELPALGRLIRELASKEKPRILQFWEDLVGAPGNWLVEYDSKLIKYGDSLGKMAYFVAKLGGRAVNMIRRGLGVSPFYGRVVSQTGPTCGVPMVLVESNHITTLFPRLTISAKCRASATVPVRTDAKVFSQKAGGNWDEVDVVMGSEHIPGLSEFLRQCYLFSGRPYVFSDFVDSRDKNAVTFWSNGARREECV